jgi:serine/threonine protein kinase
MYDSFGFEILGMFRLKTSLHREVLVLWLCLFLFAIAAESQSNVTHTIEVNALRAIRRNLIDPNRNLSNWRRGDPCTSNWTGVLCFNTTLNDGYLHVRELQLLNMNLSGTLSPELGRLAYMEILDFMWNKITGSIPREIGNIASLQLLLLNGNELTGPLPEELGYLSNLDRIQIDQNHISGPIPRTFANLTKTKHFHMNNNSLSGQIPPELSTLPNLVHMLLDNNNLSGYLPPELSRLPNLLILQLDNNQFEGSTIPSSYGNMSLLLKLSLRNCSLQGPVPDLTRIPNLAYLDLSSNQLEGSIPSGTLSDDITTIDLSYNNLNGSIPSNFSSLPRLHRLSLANNSFSGSIPSIIWQNRTFNATEQLILDLQNNRLSNISGSSNIPANVTIRLQGNPICLISNFVDLCEPQREESLNFQTLKITNDSCRAQSCPPPYEYAPESATSCFCAVPLIVKYRLKSPGFSDFVPYKSQFEVYLSTGLGLELFQLDLDSYEYQSGPRVKMNLKLFPVFDNVSYIFNRSEVLRIRGMFTGWLIPDSEIFGPYELLDFTLSGPYANVIPTFTRTGISKGLLAGVIVASICGTFILSALASLLIWRRHLRSQHAVSKRRLLSRASIKIEGVKSFSYEELKMATNSFNSSAQVGEGGYGKVYRGILADGTVVAIKRAQEGSLQGEREFLTEIELLSRLHHRNLVSLLGYCDEESEQMLVYEFMPNGTLRDHIAVWTKDPLDFAMRCSVALGSAKGILYLHTEADPPIFHRDIKASNILLDSKFTAKVADFGLSRLAPVPDIEGAVPAHVSTVVKGTPGYLDPEYFLTHKLTDKSDVYSLGVVFLELLTGMQPISHGKNIVREANIAYRAGMIFSIIDERMGSYPSECVEKFVNLALKCCKNETDARPSMTEVVRELENIWNMLPDSATGMRAHSSPIMGPEKDVSSEPSSSTTTTSTTAMRNPYVSSDDISGNDLVSGVVPTITPR